MTEQKLIDEGYVEGKKSFEFLSKEIHDNFNWENVYKAMRALEWEWSFGKDKEGNDMMGIPSMQTIKNTAFELLKEAYDKENQFGTGGFTAGWDSGELYLVFTLEETSA